MKNAKKSVEIDFSSNISICNCCGRFFKLSELEFNLGSQVNKTTTTNDRGTFNSYKGWMNAKGECPKCKTQKHTCFEVDLGSDSTVTKHIIFTDNFKTTYSSDIKSSMELQDKIKQTYNSHKNEAKLNISHNVGDNYISEYEINKQKSTTNNNYSKSKNI